MKKQLDEAVVEKDVENAYRGEILRLRPQATITSPHNVDGYAQWSTVRLLLEAKFDLDLRSRGPVCNVLGQCLLYVKKFEAEGVVPNVILVGDRKECFVLRTSSVRGFLDLPIDWTVAPSKGNPELTQALVEGVNVLPLVRSIDHNFDFNSILDEIEILAEGKEKTVRIDLINIGQIFHYFENQVFKDPSLTAVEKVDIFLRALFHAEEVYPHPTKKGVLCVPDYPEGVAIDTDQYLSFFSHFEQGYRPSEIEAFYACKDRLVEDDARRRQGAFFTPDLWVAEAHKSLEKVLGAGWRDECIVWDPAAGTANLTRNYAFTDLIISTAEKPDVQVIKDQGYNPGASIFQYDFLNPESESPFFEDSNLNMIPRSVDRRLKEAAEAGKRLVFLMNPPYGTANDAGAKGTSKAGIAKTLVNEAMKAEKLGACSQQLYAQFMYQCNVITERYGFKEHTIALFSKPTFMSSGSYRKLRHWWYERYSFQDAFLFQASHFADVSGRWGISFTVWNGPGKTPTKSKTPCALKDIPENTFKVEDTGEKSIYNSDGREASKWVREPIKELKGVDAPQLSSGLRVKEGYGCRGSLVPAALGYMTNVANCLYKSGTDVFWTTSCSSMAHGFSVLPANYRRAIALYGARKLVAGNWINDKDEYLVPNEKHPKYNQWVDDCHVYALLHSGNNCTSMRGVQYKGKDWDIHNHFFWLTRNEALEALDNRATPKLYRDCKNNPCGYLVEEEEENAIFTQEKKRWEIDGDPYFSHVLPSLNLSEEAQDVLDSLKALWTKSLSLREGYAAGKPELHLLSWDAGCYQLKHLWRDHFEEDYKALRAKFKKLEEKLKPGVYEFGFLLG